jgi:stalled ribosome rescue protein Dom34
MSKLACVIGYKRGIGKEIANVAKAQGYDLYLVGKNDWDVKEPKLLSEAIQEKSQAYSKCTVFIVAHLGFEAINLLETLMNSNVGNLSIVFLGSLVTTQTRNSLYKYHIEKSASAQAVKQLQLQYPKKDLLIINPGWVDTNLIEHIEGEKIDPKVLAEYIFHIKAFSENFSIRTLSVDVVR